MLDYSASFGRRYQLRLATLISFRIFLNCAKLLYHQISTKIALCLFTSFLGIKFRGENLLRC